MYRLFFLFCSMFYAFLCAAETNSYIILTEDFEKAYIGKSTYIYEDKDRKDDIYSILNKSSNNWELQDKDRPRKGLSSSTFWAKTIIENQTSQALPLTFVQECPMADWIQFFMVDQAQVIDSSISMGDTLPFQSRTIPHHYFAYDYVFPPNSTLTFYCKTGQLGGKFYLPLKLSKQDNWLSENNQKILSHGLILGVIFIFCLIGLLTYLSIRRKFLLFFILQNISFVLFYLSFNGMGFQYLWPNGTHFQQIAAAQTLNGIAIFKVLFFITFFNLKQIRSFKYTVMGIIGLQFLSCLFPILFEYYPIFHTSSFAKFLRIFNYSIFPLTLFSLGSLSFIFYEKTKDKNMSWYLFLITFQVVLAISAVVVYFSEIDHGDLSMGNFSIFSSLVEGLVLSLLIINYFKNVLLEKEQLALTVVEKQNEALQNLLVGQETERKRLSQELHDGLSIRVAQVKQSLNNFISLDTTPSTITMSSIAEQMDEVHQDIRNFSHALNPVLLEQLGFEKAINNIIYTLENNYLDLDISFNFSNAIPLTAVQEKHFYHIIQELINNTIKYAEANKIELTIQQTANITKLTYSDNGIGYDPKTVTEKGIGLNNIQSRVQLLNGTFSSIQLESVGMEHQIILSN